MIGNIEETIQTANVVKDKVRKFLDELIELVNEITSDEIKELDIIKKVKVLKHN